VADQLLCNYSGLTNEESIILTYSNITSVDFTKHTFKCPNAVYDIVRLTRLQHD